MRCTSDFAHRLSAPHHLVERNNPRADTRLFRCRMSRCSPKFHLELQDAERRKAAVKKSGHTNLVGLAQMLRISARSSICAGAFTVQVL